MKAERYDLDRMDAALRERVLERFVRIHDQLFDNFAGTTSSLFESPHVSRRFLTFFVDQGRDVGLCVVCAIPLDGDRIVLRGSLGLLPGHRGASVASFDAARSLARLALENPRARFFFVGYSINPGSYRMFSELTRGIYPTPRGETPDEIWSLLLEVSGRFGLENQSRLPRIFVTRPFARLREVSLRHQDSEEIRFFQAANPGWVDGQGLGLVIDLSPRNVALGFQALVRKWALKKLRAVVRADRTAGSPPPAPPAAGAAPRRSPTRRRPQPSPDR